MHLWVSMVNERIFTNRGNYCEEFLTICVQSGIPCFSKHYQSGGIELQQFSSKARYSPTFEEQYIGVVYT